MVWNVASRTSPFAREGVDLGRWSSSHTRFCSPNRRLEIYSRLGPNIRSLGLFTGAIIGLIIGVLALIGASRVSSPVWTIILMVLGYLVGSLGGILIFIGALIGLVTALVKS